MGKRSVRESYRERSILLATQVALELWTTEALAFLTYLRKDIIFMPD